MKKNKKPVIIAIILTVATAGALLIGTGKAKALGLDTVNKIIDTQLNRLVPENLRQIVAGIRSGSAIGVDDIVTIFKPADENGNINEEVWKELEQLSLGTSADRILKRVGVKADYTIGQMTQSALKNINNANNSKGRAIEKAVNDERAEVQASLRESSQDAESSLQATNQSNRIAAVAASNDLRKLDMESRSLTAQQISNANSLKQRQEQLAQKRSEQMATKASKDEQSELINITTRPYYGGQ